MTVASASATASAPASALTPVPQEHLDALFTEAHTAHTFTDQEVTDEQAQQIYDLLKMAPTSMNNQPLRITWVRSEQARHSLVETMSDGNKDKTLRAPLTAILSADNNWFEHFGTFAPWAEERKAFFANNPEIATKMARENAFIQAGYFILAVRSVGLAAGPMGGFDAAALDARFNADTGHSAILVVNIGHPAQDAYRPRGARLSTEIATRTV